MSKINFRKTANTKQGAFTPARKNCVVVAPSSTKQKPQTKGGK